MLMRREDLYEYLHNQYDGEYSIGIHGIVYENMKKSLDETINSIFQDGLNINASRTINGTVKFLGRLDNPEDKEQIEQGLSSYKWGNSDDFILVGFPAIFRTVDGKSLFLGSPNQNSKYRNAMGSGGYEITTLLDNSILDVIKPEYIIGRFRDIDSEHIEFVPNEKHISNNGGFVDDDEFSSLERKAAGSLFLSTVDISLFENIESINEVELYEAISRLELKREVGDDDIMITDQQVAFLLETLQQLFKESIKRHKSNEDEDETNSINFDTTGRNR